MKRLIGRAMSRLCLTLFVAAMTMVMGGCSGSSSPPILVSLSPASPQAIDQSQTVGITANVTSDSTNEGVSWSLAGQGSLSSTTGSSVTYSSPTTSITSAQQATVTATSVADPTKSASLQITVNPYPQLSLLQTLANGSVGTPYSQMIELTGGTPPFQWSIYNGPIVTGNYVGGGVPNGLTLNAGTGAISGTPTAGGTWYFEATVTDATGVTVSQPFLSIQINPSALPGNPIPFLNQPLVPTAVAPGGSGLVLSVSGTGFVSGATIDWNGTPLTTTFVDNEHLTAMVPAANIATAGTASVSVVNPSPAGGQSNLVFFQVGASETNVAFANAPNSPLQIPTPSGLAAADFNGDGKQDFAVGAVSSVAVMLGNGDGTFRAASGSPVPLPSPPYDDFASPLAGTVVLGDFDNSGHLGMAVALVVSDSATILLGKGNGTLVSSSAGFVEVPCLSPQGVGAGDFNADGYLDLALTCDLYEQVYIALGYGAGAFNQTGSFDTGGSGQAVAIGDFNGDGKLDVAAAFDNVGQGTSSGVAVALGNGDGTFTLANGSPISVGNTPTAIIAGDFNGDGRLDLAIADAGNNDMIILLGNGDGTFGAPSTFPVGMQPEAIVAADFNNDGKLDLAIANYGENTVTLLLGNGDGTFTEASSSPYTVGKAPLAIAAADFNGDGKLDLAVSNGLDGTGTVSILLQQ